METTKTQKIENKHRLFFAINGLSSTELNLLNSILEDTSRTRSSFFKYLFREYAKNSKLSDGKGLEPAALGGNHQN
jgi:hypothetical protein